MELAAEEDLLLRLERRPGHYLVKGRAMVMVWPGERVTEALVDKINAAFVLGNQRTAAQDVEFSVNQLVEIAVWALSPGINDPFTAVACVDRLGSALCRLASSLSDLADEHVQRKARLRGAQARARRATTRNTTTGRGRRVRPGVSQSRS